VTSTRTPRKLTVNQAALLGSMDEDEYRTVSGILRAGGLEAVLSALEGWKAAEQLVRRGEAEKGAAGGIARNTGYRLAATRHSPGQPDLDERDEYLYRREQED